MSDAVKFSQIEEEEVKEDSMFNQAECLAQIENEAIQESQHRQVSAQIKQSQNLDSIPEEVEMIDTEKLQTQLKSAADVPPPLSAYNLFMKDMRARIERGELEL